MASAIIDLSDPNVVHIIYPEGKPVNQDMMDPNIGGFLGGRNDDRQTNP